jgi:hypothetical protein
MVATNSRKSAVLSEQQHAEGVDTHDSEWSLLNSESASENSVDNYVPTH